MNFLTIKPRSKLAQMINKLQNQLQMPEQESETIMIDSEIADLFPMFIESCLQHIDSLRSSIDSKNYDQIYKSGHQLAGSGGSFGFPLVTEIGKDLMLIKDSQNLTQLNYLISLLEDHIKNVNIEYITE